MTTGSVNRNILLTYAYEKRRRLHPPTSVRPVTGLRIAFHPRTDNGIAHASTLMDIPYGYTLCTYCVDVSLSSACGCLKLRSS